MTGAMSANLTAMALPLYIIGSLADHTYVESSCGLVWGCFGRSAGGRAVTQGVGNSFVSECLSYPRDPDLWVYAGLRYKDDGLCHQATNRILHPSGIRLDNKARGYWASVARYNVYGLRKWKTIEFCYDIGAKGRTINTSSGVLRRQLSDSRFVSSSSISESIPRVTVMTYTGLDEARQIVLSMLSSGAINEVDPVDIDTLAHKQLESWQRQQELLKSLEDRIIDRKNFDRLADEEHAKTLEIFHTILGEAAFLSIFGEVGLRPDKLIDPEFLSQTSHQK